MTTGATVDNPLVSLTTLKDIRAIEKHILPLKGIMKFLQRLLVDLSVVETNPYTAQSTDGSSALAIRAVLLEIQQEAQSYFENAEYIFARAQSVAQSVSDTLNLSQSDNTLTLAKLARQDSVAIKALTLVTAFYMPFSFVAVSL